MAETIIFAAGALASVLNNRGGAWASLVAPLLGVVTYQAEALCEVDPPADPGMTSADYTALLNVSDWNAFTTALGKLADLAKIAIWYEMCECKSVGTPAPPANVFTPPEGISNPQIPTTAACWSHSSVYVFPYSPGTANQFHPDPFPQPSVHTMPAPGSGAFNWRVVPRPSSWKWLRTTIESLTPYAGASQFTQVTAHGVDSLTASSSAMLSGDLNVELHNDPLYSLSNLATSLIQIPASTQYITLLKRRNGPADTEMEVRLTLEAYCDTPGSAASPCCTPDASVSALLERILQLVTLIQRQAVPFAYIAGASSTGLSGTGEVAVSGLVAVSIELTTLPGHYGMAEGSPDAIFDVGRVALGTADGFRPSRPISTSPMYIRTGPEITRVGYALSPGVVATIREHEREP